MPRVSEEEAAEIQERIRVASMVIRQANERQVGGTHYRTAAGEGEQHWDRIWRMYGRGYFVGNITKYVERYHLKNGIEDLKKAQHYLQKLIELETAELEREKANERSEHSEP